MCQLMIIPLLIRHNFLTYLTLPFPILNIFFMLYELIQSLLTLLLMFAKLSLEEVCVTYFAFASGIWTSIYMEFIIAEQDWGAAKFTFDSNF